MIELYTSRRLKQHIFTPSRCKIIAEICELYIAGYSLNEVAKKLNISYPRVCETITLYYLPYKGDNKVTLVLKSKV